MNAMNQTREHILHDMIRERDEAERSARIALQEMFKASDAAREADRRFDNMRRAFIFSVIVGAVGWALAWVGVVL